MSEREIVVEQVSIDGVTWCDADGLASMLTFPHRRVIRRTVAAQDQQDDYEETDDDPIHLWFELSYAQYLTIPRSVLQSMPVEWQRRFAACLFELDRAIDWRPKEGRYWVKLKDGQGRYVADPLADYERGRRRVPMRRREEP